MLHWNVQSSVLSKDKITNRIRSSKVYSQSSSSGTQQKDKNIRPEIWINPYRIEQLNRIHLVCKLIQSAGRVHLEDF